MKNTMVFASLLFAVSALSAQDKGVQVSPSDQVVYPDASQVINKISGTKALPPEPLSTKPLVAATPLPARGTAPVPRAGAHGWFLRWVITADEASARAWASALAGSSVTALSAGSWEVLWGPVGADSLSTALKQSAQAQLVYR